MTTKSRWLSSLVAGVFAFVIGTSMAQILQRPLDPRTGKSAGITYFKAGSEPTVAADGELAIRSRTGQPSELVFFDGVGGGGWTVIGELKVASGSGTQNVVPRFDANGGLEDSRITLDDTGNDVWTKAGTNVQDIVIQQTGAGGDIVLDATSGDQGSVIAFSVASGPAPPNTFTFLPNGPTSSPSYTSAEFFSDPFSFEMDGNDTQRTVRIRYTHRNATGTGNEAVGLNIDGSGVEDPDANSFGLDISGVWDAGLRLSSTVTSASLIAGLTGAIAYCSDCNPDATCTAGGTGAFAFNVNGLWTCELN